MVHIKEIFQSSAKGQLFQRIGEITAEILLAVSTAKRQYDLYGEHLEICEETAYDREEMERALHTELNGEGPLQKGKFSPSQHAAFNSISDAVKSKSYKNILCRCTRRNKQYIYAYMTIMPKKIT